MWIPGPTRAVLLSTVVIGLLVIFAVYAALQVSNDVRVVYENAPVSPVYTPFDLPPLPKMDPPLPKMADPPDEVSRIVKRNVRDREGAFWSERVAFEKGKEFLEQTKNATFWVGDGYSQKMYRFSDYVALKEGIVYRHFVAAHQFYGDVYASQWVAPTIPTPKHLDLLPPNVQAMQTNKLWRAAYIYFFGNGTLNALFKNWQDRAGQLKRAYINGDDKLLDDLPHNP